jgi:hypothetical protein
MTGALDAEIGPLAVTLIAEFGKAVTLIRVTEGAYNPTTSAAAVTEASSAINALIEDYKPYELANGLATIGDKKLTVAASGLTAPKLTDAVIIEGMRFSIVSLGTVYSGELAALYVFQARKT